MNNRKIATPIAGYLFAVSCLLAFTNMAGMVFRGFALYYGFENYLSLAASIALCVVLLMKRRDVVLLGVIALRTAMQLITLFANFGLLSLLNLVAWGALLLLAYCVIDQDLIKVDLSKAFAVIKKFYFAPAAVMVLCALISLIRNIIGFGIVGAIRGFVSGLVIAAAAYFLAQWLLDPYEKETPVTEFAAGGQNAGYTAGQVVAPAAPVPTAEGYYNLITHVVLCLFTFGIWQFIWIYRATKFLNTAPGVEQHNPTNKLLLCLFVPFYSIYWFYKQGQRLDVYCRAKKLPASDMANLCLILGIFLPIAAVILMQDRFNSICIAE